MKRQTTTDAVSTASKRPFVRRAIAAVASAAMLLTIVPLAAQTATADEPSYSDNGTIHTYAPTGAGTDVLGNKTDSPDVASDKYQVSVNGTDVEAVQYTAKGHNFDIARFASSSRTPVVKVTMIDGETIDKVNIYPEHYYEGKYEVSADKKTLTFKMEQSLISAMVMINSGDQVNAKGQPYLALINDTIEDKTAAPSDAEGASADEKAWGYNEATGVLNFKTFAKKYLESAAGAKLPDGKTTVKKQEAIKAHATSLYNDGAGATVGGQKVTGMTSDGQIVDPSKTQVGYPDQRRMSDDDATYALQAAFDFIENKGATLNTLYFPNGTYTYGGLDVNGIDGGKVKGGTLKIYADEGALLKNHVQPYREAQEPAIGIWNSKHIELSGRGIYDGQGAKNYSDKNGNTSGDKNDAFNSQHQAGVMVVQSSDIVFNDTYMRGAKQWNWETHTAKNVTFNNIKGLTPYEMSWGDGMDFASGQNLTVNGAVTFGNDDTFASGHYNPGRWFQPDKPDLYNKMFKFNTDSPNIQGYDNAVGGYDAFVKSHGIDNDSWDTADSHDITLNNTLGWSFSGGNGIRLGHEAHGYQLRNYTFNNFNSLGFKGGGRAVTIQNHTDIYPRYENIVIKDSSFDTSRVGTNFDINGADGSSKVTVNAADQKENGYRPNPDGSGADYNVDREPIANVTIDNTWFSNANAGFGLNNVTNATVNDLHVGGKQVQYSNQAKFAKNDSVAKLAYTYTDADGKTQDVKQNTVPTFTSPAGDLVTATAGQKLAFDVKADDPDVANGDNVKLSVSDLGELAGAAFDAATGAFTWTPTEEQAGKNYTVTFTAADAGAQAGDYDATVKTIRIRVVSAKSEVKSVASTADAYVASWKTNKTTDYSANPGGKNTAGYFAVRNASGKGLLGEQNKSTNTGDGTDVKIGFVQFDLSQFAGTTPSAAQLKLTLIGRRYDTANRADEQITVTPVNADKRLDGTAFDGKLAGMTWNTRPDFDAAEDATTTSAAFDNGNNEVRNDVPGSVAGTEVTVDVTKAVQDAIAAGKTTLLLAVGGKNANDELYFVNTKGAAEGIYGAKAEQAPALDVTLPTAQPASDVLADFTFDDLKDGATGYLDDASSAATASIEGKAAVGTNDSDSTTAAKIGNGFWLNLAKADGTPLLKGADALTVTFDAKPDSGNPGWAFYAAPNANAPVYNKSEHYLGVMAKPGSVTVERYNTDGNRDTRGNVSGDAPASGWYKVAVTVSDDFTRLYVNGKLVKESTDVSGLGLPAILGEGGGILQIGKANWGSGEYYSGLLDNLKIYNRALTGEEIAAGQGGGETPSDKTAPVFSGVDDVTLDYGATFDPLTGVKATDDVDGDVTASIKVSGTVDTSKAGKYTLTYTVSDKAGNEAKATRTVTVKEKPAEPVTVTAIAVDAGAAKTEYTVGDTFSADGLKVTKTLSTGDTVDAAAGEYALTAASADGTAVDLKSAFADSLAGATVTVTVTYTGADAAEGLQPATFTVTVKAKDVEPEPTPATDAEFKALGEAIDAAKTLQEKDYKSGWDAFQSALASAEKVFENKASTSDQVNGALKALQDAVKGLVANGTGNNNGNNNGGNAGAGDNAGNGNGSAVKPGSAKPQQKPAGGLSNTGSDVAAVFAVMAVLVLAGGAALALRRRA